VKTEFLTRVRREVVGPATALHSKDGYKERTIAHCPVLVEKVEPSEDEVQMEVKEEERKEVMMQQEYESCRPLDPTPPIWGYN